ncbi:probable G-protein coupled receptor frpr-1 [Aplysia californica]|uniref:Probable G-protein coupled receptor frpr-1 n=1 Tax=Aplysia californica TaxID=6500 RepID=A0ABM0K4L9_APLCA|nr:probable G-protein coupled receptor frpr-1 [Aplysia californica]
MENFTSARNFCSQELDTFQPPAVLVSNSALRMLEIVLDLVFSNVVACTGVVTNVLDLAVFYRQGFQDSVNVSLAAIALWDLAKCLCGAAFRLHGLISLFSPFTGFIWKNLSTPNLQNLQRLIGYTSYAMAAYVAVERCLCVSMPFKVKTIVTPKLTFLMMLAISVGVFGSFVIMLFIYRIDWVCSSEYFGRTIAVYSYNDFYYENGVHVVTYYNIIGILNPVISFSIMVVCTVIIYYHLRRASDFRIKSQHGDAGASGRGKDLPLQMSVRDRQVIRMLLVVILVYIVNFVPLVAQYVAKLMIPEFYFLKRYHNSFVLTAYLMFLVDLVNASVNFFIYLTMSSNFRRTFFDMFSNHRKG